MIMTSIASDCTSINVSGELIEQFISDPSLFSSFTINSNVNCCDTTYTYEYENSAEVICVEWKQEDQTNDIEIDYIEFYDVEAQSSFQVDITTTSGEMVSQIDANEAQAQIIAGLSSENIDSEVEMYYDETANTLTTYIVLDVNYTPTKIVDVEGNEYAFACLKETISLDCDTYIFTVPIDDSNDFTKFFRIRTLKPNGTIDSITNTFGTNLDFKNNGALNTLVLLLSNYGYTGTAVTNTDYTVTVTITDVGEDQILCMDMIRPNVASSGREVTQTYLPECSGEETSTIISFPDGITIGDNEIIVDKDFYDIEALKDGIYSFDIKAVYTNTDIVMEKGCAFIDCDLKCKIIDKLVEDCDSPVSHLYERIKDAMECGDCSCEKACILLQKLINELNINPDSRECNIFRVCGCG